MNGLEMKKLDTSPDKIRNDYEMINRHHCTTSIHRNIRYHREYSEARFVRSLPRASENQRQQMSAIVTDSIQLASAQLEQRANNIVNYMEQDQILIADNPESEKLRRETLRDMPQCLTIKRIIKTRLDISVSRHSEHKRLRFWRGIKYRLNNKAFKVQNILKSIIYTFELWYSSLKTIEGHFGSAVAAYFKFFRRLFLLNCFILVLVTSFIVIPQLLYTYLDSGVTNKNLKVILSERSNKSMKKVVPRTLKKINNVDFAFQDLFTGEGFLTCTLLYYGYYTDNNVNLIAYQTYQMPLAYFFTMLSVYLFSFLLISISMARSYRRSFIETQGGLKNVYAHKIFCGWDYSIATKDAAELKSSSIYNELKEHLDETTTYTKDLDVWHKFWTYTIQTVTNFLVILKLVGVGYLLWYLLEKNNTDEAPDFGVIAAICINIVMMMFPTFFSFLVRYEDYQHPRAALYVILIRTFLLKTVLIGVFLAFWLTHSNDVCWEISVGQHMYRLIVFDFSFAVIAGTLIQTIRFLIYKKLWTKIGMPEFDTASHALQLMYNQTLFWVGLYFSPLLPLVVVVKLWITWYIKRTFLLHCCRLPTKSWRAAQTHTWFLILSFLSLLLVIITYGYILVWMSTSDCGPFKKYHYIYEMITKSVFQLQKNSPFLRVILYLTKPGVVSLLLLAMIVVVYYLRAKGLAQKTMVNILQEMLVLEAKDKEFLLKNISKITEGQWQYNLQNQTGSYNFLVDK